MAKHVWKYVSLVFFVFCIFFVNISFAVIIEGGTSDSTTNGATFNIPLNNAVKMAIIEGPLSFDKGQIKTSFTIDKESMVLLRTYQGIPYLGYDTYGPVSLKAGDHQITLSVEKTTDLLVELLFTFPENEGKTIYVSNLKLNYIVPVYPDKPIGKVVINPDNSIKITWTDSGTGVPLYKVMAQVPGSPWVIVADGLTKKSLDIDSVGQDPLFGYVKIIAKNGALETESDNIDIQLFDLTAIPKPLNLTVKENEPGIAHIEWTPIAGSKYQVFKKEAANDISLGIVTVPYFDFTTSLKTTFYVKAIDIKSSLVGLKSNEVSNPMDAANLQNIKASFDGTYLTSSFEINPLFQKYIIKTEMSINSMSWQPYSDKVLVSNSKSPYVVAIKVYYSTGTEKTTSVIAGIGNLNYAFGTLTNSGKFTLFFDGDPGITVKVSDSVETFNLSYSGDSIPKNVNFWGSKIQIEYLLSNISIGKVEVNIPVTGLDICFWQLKKGWNLISVPLLASDFSSKVMTIGNNEISLFQKLNLQIINGVALLNVLKDTILLVEGYYPYAWSNPYSNLSPATVEISPMYEMTIFPKDKEIYTWIGGIVKGRKGENIIPGLTFLQKIIPGYGIVITDFDIINISK